MGGQRAGFLRRPRAQQRHCPAASTHDRPGSTGLRSGALVPGHPVLGALWPGGVGPSTWSLPCTARVPAGHCPFTWSHVCRIPTSQGRAPGCRRGSDAGTGTKWPPQGVGRGRALPALCRRISCTRGVSSLWGPRGHSRAPPALCTHVSCTSPQRGARSRLRLRGDPPQVEVRAAAGAEGRRGVMTMTVTVPGLGPAGSGAGAEAEREPRPLAGRRPSLDGGPSLDRSRLCARGCPQAPSVHRVGLAHRGLWCHYEFGEG